MIHIGKVEGFKDTVKLFYCFACSIVVEFKDTFLFYMGLEWRSG
jgi:hypothetical protein